MAPAHDIRRPLDFRTGCHQAASVGNQLSLVMFSGIGLGFRFPFVPQYPSAMWLLLGCLPSVVSNQFLSAPEPPKSRPTFTDVRFGVPPEIYEKNQCQYILEMLTKNRLWSSGRTLNFSKK